MPVAHGNIVRVTSAEHGALITQARRHGRAHLLPRQIQTGEDLENARYAAGGAQLLEDLERYIEEGSSPGTRGQLSRDALWGETPAV